jgi:NAD-dependent aldehyde dehydrogenases
MSAGAMITGNTVVFKPSSTDNMTMLTGLYIYKMFSEAGIPRGVFNYITGPGSEVGEKLVSSPKVSGIAFTGSRSTGMSMMRRSLEMGQNKIFVVEMGGKNAVIVSKSADIDTAVNGVMSSAFGFAGQKCSAASRLYVHESISNEVIDRLVGRVKSLKIGNPLVKENYVGPLISEKALDKFRYAVDEASKTDRSL